MKFLVATIALVTLLVPALAFMQVEDQFTIGLEIVSADAIPPSIPTGVTTLAIAPTQIDVSWTASTDNIGVSGYQIFRDSVAIATVTAPAITYSDTGLVPETTYAYTVQAFDIYNNYSAQSATSNATTPAVPVTPPAAVDEGGSAGSSNTLTEFSLKIIPFPGIDSVLLEINSPVPAQAEVSWGRSPDGEMGTLSSSIYKPHHRTLITGLTPNTVYFVKVRATDGVGRVVEKTIQITTGALLLESDILPENPSNFDGVGTKEGIALSWKNPKNPEFSRVRIMRHLGNIPTDPQDGTFIYEGKLEEFLDRNVEEGAIYGYTIFAQDHSGRYSSGAVAIVKAYTEGEDQPYVVLLPHNEFETDTNELFAGLRIIQDGKQISAVQDVFGIDTQRPFAVLLSARSVPKVLKTILVTLKHPDDSSRTFSFLLRLNDAHTQYQAHIGALGEAGEYPTTLSILNFRLGSIATIRFTISATESTPVSTDASEGDTRNLVLISITVVLGLLLLLLIFLLLFRREKEREEEHTHVL